MNLQWIEKGNSLIPVVDTLPCVSSSCVGTQYHTDDLQLTKESDMSYAQTHINLAPAQQDEGKAHIDQRVYSIFYDKKEELADKFLREDKPETYGDARKWIAEGKFQLTVDKSIKDEGDFNPYNWSFRWGTKERDEEGFDQAMISLKKARQDCLDICSILSDENKRLEALKAFEAYDTQS